MAKARLGASTCAHLEHRHHLRHAVGLLAQAFGGGGALLHQCGVLQGHLVQIANGQVDARNAFTLHSGGGGDFTNDIGHAPHRLHDFTHGFARIGHQLGAGLHLGHRGANQSLDFLGCLRAALGQAANFTGDHGKTSALLPCPGGLHCGIEGQNIGLERNAVDHADDVGNLAAAGIDFLHGGHHLRHHIAAALGHGGCAGRQTAGLAGVLGAVLHGVGQRVHAGGGGLQVARSLLGALGQVVVAAGDFCTGDGNAVGAAAHFGHHAAQ